MKKIKVIIIFLIVILILILVKNIYTVSTEESSTGIPLSEKEIEYWNNKFIRYEGENVKGTKINALINEIYSNNISHQDRSIKMILDGKEFLSGDEKKENLTKVPTGNQYKVELYYDKEGIGRVIIVTTQEIKEIKE